MSDDATSWARAMSRELDLKTATRFVLLTLANDAPTDGGSFKAYQKALAADTGMSLTALKSHLRTLRTAQLVIAGDPRLVAHIPRQDRPCVYRLNLWIEVGHARRLLAEPVDNSTDSEESGQAESGDRRNPPIETPESRENPDRRNPPVQTPETSGFDRRNPPTNPLGGLYGGTNGPRRVDKSKAKKTKANDDGKRLCMECTARKPLGLMIQRDDNRFMCEVHLND